MRLFRLLPATLAVAIVGCGGGGIGRGDDGNLYRGSYSGTFDKTSVATVPEDLGSGTLNLEINYNGVITGTFAPDGATSGEIIGKIRNSGNVTIDTQDDGADVTLNGTVTKSSTGFAGTLRGTYSDNSRADFTITVTEDIVLP